MAIRAKKNRLFRVSEEAAIGNGIILEKGDRILVLREDEIPNIAADETRDPENDVGYDIVDDAAADFSEPTQESRRAAFRKKMEMARRRREAMKRKKMEMARRRREAMKRKKMREDMIIDEEDETSEEPMSEEDEVETDKVEERYQRILRRREAARRAMKRGVRRSESRNPVARKPLSIVERKARLARAKREMMLRRRARLSR